MDDAKPALPLTDYALQRLRSLAKDNGLLPEQIILMTGDEQVYQFEGTITLEPLSEAKDVRYGGPVRSKDRKMFPNLGAMRQEVDKRKKEFRSKPDWVETAKAELIKEAGQGWGFDNARIELPNYSGIFAATETCVNCQGRKIIQCAKCFGRGYEICYQCKGTRQEICYNCNGSGQNPQVPGQLCVICHGNRHIPCRLCHGTGQTACPLCLTKGGTPCSVCKGLGSLTEELHLTCGAVTHFNFKAEGLPSGMRRGLDRLGIANLPKGHATISLIADEPTGGFEIDMPESSSHDFEPGDPRGADAKKAAEPQIRYIAEMPFADLRMDFNGKKAIIGVFGNKRVFLDVPPFLDTALEPWRTKLENAWRGKTHINEALEARAVRDALDLNLQGKGTVKELRRIYPVGLSTDVANELLRGTKRLTKRLTVATRTAAAAVAGLLSAGLFYTAYDTGLSGKLASPPLPGTVVRDFAPPLIAVILGMALVTLAAHLHLGKHFPASKKAIKLTADNTVLFMTLGIVVLWLLMLYASPSRPFWLNNLLSIVHH